MLAEAHNLFLTLLVFASAALCIGADLSGRRRGVYVFKPLTIVLVLLLALQAPDGASPFYRAAIVAGLLFSLAGDVWLMLPSDRFRAGLGSFLVAHLCYVAAFGSAIGYHGSPWTLVPFVLGGAAIYRFLSPTLGALRIPVLVYMTAIVAMAWLSIERARALEEVGSLIACAGALLFVSSDALLAVNRFRRPLPASPLLVLGSYFAAQWLIALSTGVGEDLLDWSIR
jgi:uncharacterized membrane protein YhhN